MNIKDHLIARVMGGSNNPINLRKSDQKEERAKHLHHGIMLPHEKWEHDADWDSTVLRKEVRKRLSDLIDEFGPDMYLPEAVRDWTKIDNSFRKRNGIYIPKDYEQ